MNLDQLGCRGAVEALFAAGHGESTGSRTKRLTRMQPQSRLYICGTKIERRSIIDLVPLGGGIRLTIVDFASLFCIQFSSIYIGMRVLIHIPGEKTDDVKLTCFKRLIK